MHRYYTTLDMRLVFDLPINFEEYMVCHVEFSCPKVVELDPTH